MQIEEKRKNQKALLVLLDNVITSGLTIFNRNRGATFLLPLAVVEALEAAGLGEFLAYKRGRDGRPLIVGEDSVKVYRGTISNLITLRAIFDCGEEPDQEAIRGRYKELLESYNRRAYELAMKTPRGKNRAARRAEAAIKRSGGVVGA